MLDANQVQIAYSTKIQGFLGLHTFSLGGQDSRDSESCLSPLLRSLILVVRLDGSYTWVSLIAPRVAFCLSPPFSSPKTYRHSYCQDPKRCLLRSRHASCCIVLSSVPPIFEVRFLEIIGDRRHVRLDPSRGPPASYKTGHNLVFSSIGPNFSLFHPIHSSSHHNPLCSLLASSLSSSCSQRSACSLSHRLSLLPAQLPSVIWPNVAALVVCHLGALFSMTCLNISILLGCNEGSVLNILADLKVKVDLNVALLGWCFFIAQKPYRELNLLVQMATALPGSLAATSLLRSMPRSSSSPSSMSTLVVRMALNVVKSSPSSLLSSSYVKYPFGARPNQLTALQNISTCLSKYSILLVLTLCLQIDLCLVSLLSTCSRLIPGILSLIAGA